MLSRKQFAFPPFVNLIQLTIKHKQPEAVRDASILLATLIRKKLGARILGPTTPIVSRIRLLYLRQILIKIEKKPSFIRDSKRIILDSIAEVKKKFSTIRVVIDVDP
jgi:primosomal protein N' (replication factor Y)